jgi:putative DNA primase/helicase
MRELANRAGIWASGHFKALSEADPALPDGLYNRDRDNWFPLITIADELSGHWPQTAREIARLFSGKSEDPTEAVMLLADIRSIFARAGADRLATQSLINALCADEERPWCEYDRGGAVGKAAPNVRYPVGHDPHRRQDA